MDHNVTNRSTHPKGQILSKIRERHSHE
uniref:Uncharacterized protein n=1 Tax=Arundo donax TaxID=35708 RepID=A0A0A9G4P3_ARUDO